MAALGQSSPRAPRSPALPSMIASTGTRNPRATRSSEAAFPCRERLAFAQFQGDQALMPVGKDADQPSSGTLTTFPALRTRRAKASR